MPPFITSSAVAPLVLCDFEKSSSCSVVEMKARLECEEVEKLSQLVQTSVLRSLNMKREQKGEVAGGCSDNKEELFHYVSGT